MTKWAPKKFSTQKSNSRDFVLFTGSPLPWPDRQMFIKIKRFRCPFYGQWIIIPRNNVLLITQHPYTKEAKVTQFFSETFSLPLWAITDWFAFLWPIRWSPMDLSDSVRRLYWTLHPQWSSFMGLPHLFNCCLYVEFWWCYLPTDCVLGFPFLVLAH